MANNKDKKIANLSHIFPDLNMDIVGVKHNQGPCTFPVDELLSIFWPYLLDKTATNPANAGKLKSQYVGMWLKPIIPITIVEEEIDISPADYPLNDYYTADHNDAELVYCIPYRRVLLKAPDGAYYGRFRDFAGNYNNVEMTYLDVEGIPLAHRIFVAMHEYQGFTYPVYYKWNGEELVPSSANSPFTESFDAIFNALCKVSTASSPVIIGKIVVTHEGKFYRLNGIDLTPKEAFDVVADTLRPFDLSSLNADVLPQRRIVLGRTNFTFNITSIDRPLLSGSRLETLRFGSPSVDGDFTKQGNVRIRCHTAFSIAKVHTIYGRLDIEYDAYESHKKIFMASNLQKVYMKILEGVRLVDLSGCPKLSLESFTWLVGNAPSGGYITPVTIVVKSATIDLMESDTQWATLATTAASKNISFTDSYPTDDTD